MRVRPELRTVMIAVLFAVANALGAELKVRTDEKGLSSLSWSGIELLLDGSPVETHAVLETSFLNENGHRDYKFERPALTDMRSEPGQAGRVIHRYGWGSFEYSYEVRRDRLELTLTVRSAGKHAIADFGVRIMRLKFPSLPMPADRFSVRWTGQLEAPVSGEYTFHAVTDDGVRLWVANKKIIDQWRDQPPTEASGKLELEAGRRYPIRMEYYENTGGACAQLLWTPPGRQKEVIPASHLYASEGTRQRGLSAVYFVGTDLQRERFRRVDENINFNWGEQSPEGEGFAAAKAFRSTLDDLVYIAVPFGQGVQAGGKSPWKLVLACATFDPPMRFGLRESGENTYDLVAEGGVNCLAPNGVEYPPLGYPRAEPERPVTLRFSLRFASSDVPTVDMVADLIAAFREYHKPRLDWKDRRPIGALFLPSGKGPAGNPRNWFGRQDIDIRTPEGRRELRKLFLEYAERSVAEIKKTNAQGMIVWNLEGEENPHPITYIGDPRLAKLLAPEADEIYDEFFAKFREAGLKVGCTLRPTQVYFDKDKGRWDHGTGSHSPDRNPLGDDFGNIWPKGLPWWRFYPVAERLSRKIEYAKKRWGATIFYVDTNGVYRQVGEGQKFEWTLLECRVWREVLRRHPDVLLIPEFASAPAQYAYTSCYLQPPYSPVVTPEAIRALLPGAFSVTYVVNLPREQLEPMEETISEGVRRGDSMFFRGWFGDWYNPWIKSIYEKVYKPGAINPGL